MKIAFVHNNSESLSIEYLSAFLRKNGHETCLAFDPQILDDGYFLNIPILKSIFNSEKEIVKKIRDYNPPIVCFSVVTNNYKWALRLSEKIKKEINPLIIFGGIHPTCVPEIVIKNKFVDIVCIGEGEYQLLELVNNIEKNIDYTNIKGLWIKKEGKVYKNKNREIELNLDNFPFPDKSLFEKNIRMDEEYDIMTTRGCPFRCSYCLNGFLQDMYKGKYLRRRSVRNVIDELVKAKEKYNYKTVSFGDDVFIYDKKWLRDFIKEYKEKINVPFFCLGYPTLIDEEIAYLLKNGGCYRIKLGLQSTNKEIREKVFNRYGSEEKILSGFKNCDRVGLNYSIDMIFGVKETFESYEKGLKSFLKLNRLMGINCYYLVYFPKTNIIKYGLKEKLITQKQINEIELGDAYSYIQGGSIYNKRYIKKLDNITKLYRVSSVIPKKLTKFLLKNKRYILLSFIPPIIICFIEWIFIYKSKNKRAKLYVDFYIRHIKMFLLNKIFQRKSYRK